ncbi:hypothetical protein F5X68DRAFT_250925 [Plectosphaerella plurivora]|uniref:Uncharacterized protein n=1 Tax=Plectosphaerella plurivora TaxID=936078 RepID=A0A9P9ABH2_9PEZI|nr:hypothetical protein F5X68DRAFT_250925 [Plectosphaerella plurivora]
MKHQGPRESGLFKPWGSAPVVRLPPAAKPEEVTEIISLFAGLFANGKTTQPATIKANVDLAAATDIKREREQASDEDHASRGIKRAKTTQECTDTALPDEQPVSGPDTVTTAHLQAQGHRTGEGDMSLEKEEAQEALKTKADIREAKLDARESENNTRQNRLDAWESQLQARQNRLDVRESNLAFGEVQVQVREKKVTARELECPNEQEVLREKKWHQDRQAELFQVGLNLNNRESELASWEEDLAAREQEVDDNGSQWTWTPYQNWPSNNQRGRGNGGSRNRRRRQNQ